MLKTHSFHTYEGGEGNLTSLHSNLYFLLGNDEFNKGNYQKAKEYYLIGLDYPLNYHETITLHADNSHLYYKLALVSKELGETSKMNEYLEKGISSLACPNPNFYFAAKCYELLNRKEEAKAKLEALYEAGKDLYDNRDLDSYFGVGAPTRLPFAYDIDRVNTIKSLELEIFALLGEGKTKEAEEKKKELRKLDLSSIALTLTSNI